MRPRRRSPSLTTIAARVDGRLRDLLDAEGRAGAPSTRRWSSRSRRCATWSTPGGKRLRPAFCHWGFVAAGRRPRRPAGGRRGRRSRCCTCSRSCTTTSWTARPPGGARTTHLAFADAHPRGGVAGRGPALRRGGGDPRRRHGARVRRRPARRRARPTCGRCGTSCASSSTWGSTSTCWAPPGATATGRRPPHRPLQVGQVHDRAAPARRRGAGGPARRPRRRPCRPTATRWARRSSSATTSSGRSATRRGRASPWARTSARASPRLCWPRPSSGRRRRRRRAPPRPCSPGSASPTSPTPTWPPSSTCWSTRGRSPRSRPRRRAHRSGGRRHRGGRVAPRGPRRAGRPRPLRGLPRRLNPITAEPGAGRQAGRKTDRAR